MKLLPDGASFFTRKMGMACVWDTERGFGGRSWRYSAVFDNMVIEKLFVEVILCYTWLLYPFYVCVMLLGRISSAEWRSRPL